MVIFIPKIETWRPVLRVLLSDLRDAVTTRTLVVRSVLPATPAYETCFGPCFWVRPAPREGADIDSIGGTDVALVILREVEGGNGEDSLTRLRPRCVGTDSGDSEARGTADFGEVADEAASNAGDAAADDGTSESPSLSCSWAAGETSWPLVCSTAISGLEIGVADLDEACDRGDGNDNTGVGSWSMTLGAGETGSMAWSLFAWTSGAGSKTSEGLFFRFFGGLPRPFPLGLCLGLRPSSCFIFSVSL